MYQEFFSLKIKPFSISPDPNFIFFSEQYKEALTHLQTGLRNHVEFALLTGEVGTGKTTICRSLIEQMSDDTDIVSILNPALSETELLSTICDSLKIEYENSQLNTLFNLLTNWIIHNCARNRHTVVIIDEAQHLSLIVLEQLRLLTAIEINNKKPLQVILIGQTELQNTLNKSEFYQLSQSINVRYHLLSLSQQESNLYIQHRLNIAGSNHTIFDSDALQEVFEQCRGTPRLTNILCDRSLLVAYTKDSHVVTLKMIKHAITEMHFTPPKPEKALLFMQGRFSALIALSLLALWLAPKASQYINEGNLQIATTEPLKPQYATIPETTEQWFDEYPQLDLTHTDYNNALANLYAVWGYQVDSQSVNCDQDNSARMHCYSRSINLQQLKKLNYPSIVRLEKDDENTVHAVIYKIAENYQLLIDGHLIVVTEQWFSNYWSGETTLLWQAPFALNEVIKFSQKGKKVTWLANQLNKLQGWPSENKREFDLRLLEQVSAFQREHGLMDDGIVDPQTLMALMQLVSPHSPRLLQETK